MGKSLVILVKTIGRSFEDTVISKKKGNLSINQKRLIERIFNEIQRERVISGDHLTGDTDFTSGPSSDLSIEPIEATGHDEREDVRDRPDDAGLILIYGEFDALGHQGGVGEAEAGHR